MKFTKMHGTGNDYVYVNAFEETVADPERVARFVSDRHFGVGSDGLILIRPSAKADCWMDMYNADGSSSEMCGNGIRCVAKYVYDHRIVTKNPMTIETGAGVKTIRLAVEDGKAVSAQVDMGCPVLLSRGNTVCPEISNRENLAKLPVWEKIVVDGTEYEMIAISVGNPHAVVYVEDVARVDIEKIGPKFENHERFPERTNVEFIQIADRKHMNMRVWERGTGETLACGTGATASGVASMLAGYVDTEVTVHLLGGDLTILWDQESGHVKMTGPAVEVFSGEIETEGYIL
ncbi:MAG: diaminopimelate epimerase [Lachnospiraceae bacterium]|nr:diaminopimelate epimerase [Lachnospiraceae bacterium]